jgi:hypothetical protein
LQAVDFIEANFANFNVFEFFLTTAEFAWFDKLTMSGRKPLTLSLSKGAAPSVPPR